MTSSSVVTLSPADLSASADLPAAKLLRLSLGLLISLRGLHRLFFEGQDWLAYALGQQGLPFAYACAVLISLSEAAAGLSLLLGWRVKAAAYSLILTYLSWLLLLQRKNGWFDLGSENYGMECSVLIIVALLSLAWYQSPAKQKWATSLLRYFTAFFVMLHGWHRIENGGWVAWGTYLSEQGWPFGVTLTAAITALEAFAAPVFAVARWPILSWILGGLFCALYSVAIYLHHWQFGWFLKPHGVNGIEAAVLLLTCFVCAMLSLPKNGELSAELE